MLLKRLGSKTLDPKLLITHRFKLDGILDAYDTFRHAAKTKALKVIIDDDNNEHRADPAQ